MDIYPLSLIFRTETHMTNKSSETAISYQASFLNGTLVLSEGFEPPITVPKTVVISISPRELVPKY